MSSWVLSARVDAELEEVGEGEHSQEIRAVPRRVIMAEVALDFFLLRRVG